MRVQKQTELRGRAEGLITDLAGESLRRYTPRRVAVLRQDPAAGYRWLWPFHRSAPKAAANGKTINIQTTLKKKTHPGSASSQHHSPIL